MTRRTLLVLLTVSLLAAPAYGTSTLRDADSPGACLPGASDCDVPMTQATLLEQVLNLARNLYGPIRDVIGGFLPCNSVVCPPEPPESPSVPGPLVFNAWWNGTGTPIEYAYVGSYECDVTVNSISDYPWIRAVCTPLDPTFFHCVNPGVSASNSGTDTVLFVGLRCGSISGGCWTPPEIGSCAGYFGGDEIADVICESSRSIITGGGGSQSFPHASHITCFSDPPQLPPPSAIVG